ncbi:MAG: FmdB family zinc ribbon protein [Candidatus Aminicenantia bacterium]
MPIYEYRCTKCGHKFEVLQNHNRAPLQKCIKCSGKIVKILSPPMLQFKGSGWYLTDYSNKAKSSDHSPSKEKTTPSSQNSHHPPFAD